VTLRAGGREVGAFWSEGLAESTPARYGLVTKEQPGAIEKDVTGVCLCFAG